MHVNKSGSSKTSSYARENSDKYPERVSDADDSESLKKEYADIIDTLVNRRNYQIREVENHDDLISYVHDNYDAVNYLTVITYLEGLGADFTNKYHAVLTSPRDNDYFITLETISDIPGSDEIDYLISVDSYDGSPDDNFKIVDELEAALPPYDIYKQFGDIRVNNSFGRSHGVGIVTPSGRVHMMSIKPINFVETESGRRFSINARRVRDISSGPNRAKIIGLKRDLRRKQNPSFGGSNKSKELSK